MPSTAHILVVDDEPDMAEMIRYAVAQDGIEVRVCLDGLDAIEAARKEPADVMLLDVGVPGANGFEVCREVRAFEAPENRATIVMITGRHDTASKLLAFSVGADDYLVKPVDIHELRSRVMRWIDLRRQHADLIMRRRREAIDEIVTAICHEVNNPLAVALMGVDMLNGNAGLDDSGRHDVALIRDHLVRIRDIMQSLQYVPDRTITYVGSRLMTDLGNSLHGDAEGSPRPQTKHH